MQTSYPYINQSLTPKNAQPLIVELFGNKGKIRKKKIVDDVTRTHLNRGGLPPNCKNPKNVNQYINKALNYLRIKGFAENTCPRYWKIFKISRTTGQPYGRQ